MSIIHKKKIKQVKAHFNLVKWRCWFDWSSSRLLDANSFTVSMLSIFCQLA